LILTALIVTAQLIDTYVRRLAFARSISSDVKRQLWLAWFAWSVASFQLYDFIFAEFGVNAATYKPILMLGWLPYFLISWKFIPWSLPSHVFVFGMAAICALVQHTVATSIVLLNFRGLSDANIIIAEATGYLLLYIICLPLYGKYFVKFLPNREFFDMRPIGIYIAVMPLVIISGHLLRIADDILVHSWAERLSRMYLPIVFFFFYRYILSAAKSFYDLQRLEQNKIRLKEQLDALKEYNDDVRENQKFISVMRHDLRHSYNLIYAMLESGNVEKAREHIAAQKVLLETAKVSARVSEVQGK